jgi:hypothetical protein
MCGCHRKGFLLSLDAIIAIGFLLTLALFIGGLSFTYQSPELRYQRLYYTGKDLLLMLENARIEQLQEFETIQYYQDKGILVQEDMEKTLLDIIGSMWSSDNTTFHAYAANITGDIFNTTLPSSYNYKVILGGDTIYQRGPDTGNYLSRLFSLVSGIERGKPVDGYFARAYPVLFGKTGSEYYYFGGYVGEGNITVYMDLPKFDSIIEMAMELDSGSNFTLAINNQTSGHYEKQTNETMRSNRWNVGPSYFGNLENGTNTIDILFDDSYSYLGGGYIKIVYNVTDIIQDQYIEYGENASRIYRLPGINGIMNLYSSIYVPGVLKEINAYLHYESLIPGVNTYFAVGNVSIYESNLTGDVEAVITNSSISGNLSDRGVDFSYLNSRTVPLRMALGNISYVFGEAGAADVVLITDRTGSMTSCDVSTSYATSCDSYYPYNDRRSLVAQESDRAFVNTILGAEGRNYVGLIGYGERHGKTCSFHEISNDNSSLQKRIEDYNYGGSWQDCGYTCTSCGVVGATELLQEKETLYNMSLKEDIERSEYTMSSSSISREITLNPGSINKSRFIKSRLSIMARSEDTDNGYQQCVFINGNYLGRVCVSSEGSSGWHTCSYVVDKDWLIGGGNELQLTSGSQNDCLGSDGGTWYAKDIKLSVWEYNTNQSIESTNSSSQTMNINMITHYSFAEIWENETDYPNPVDFTSGLNTSGNTFGLGSAVDGWDWDDGTYGIGSGCSFNGIADGELELYVPRDASCAYGVEVEITPEIYGLAQAGGKVAVSFLYEWDGNDNPFEDSDEAWVKARWESPTSGSHYLGSDLDSSHEGDDGTIEVFAVENPDFDDSGFFYQDITSWMEGAGTYYLDFGGKIDSNRDNEWGHFRFDDVAVSVYNESDPVFMFSFPGVNMSKVTAATLNYEARNIDPDKFDCAYVNGYHIGMADYQEVDGTDTWQDVSFDVPVMYLQEGENEIEFTGGTEIGCNRTGDNDQWSLRNVELSLVHGDEKYEYKRRKSMLIMSDGEANTIIGDCRNYGSSSCPEIAEWDTPANETVKRACEAHDKYNITIYAVVFGDAGQDAEDMLQAAACCDNCSHFYSSSSADELQEIYSNIAQGILNASFEAQTIEVSYDVGAMSNLYPDSYIRINYTSNIDPPEYGEITLSLEGQVFGNMSGSEKITDPVSMTKEGWFFVPGNIEVLEARVTSYSSQYWTDRLFVRNSSIDWTRVYWLEDFGNVNYTDIGDPFAVHIPVKYIDSGGNNSVRIGTGFSPFNGTGGSPDSRVIYTGRMGGITMEGYSDVFPKAEGSTVDVYYDIDADNVSDGWVNMGIGTNPSDVFDPMNDSIDNAFMRLMDMLNIMWDNNPGSIGDGTPGNPYDGGITGPDNPIDFQITGDILFDSASISGVPSMWGPVNLEVLVWN